jgi:hypothetical protein
MFNNTLKKKSVAYEKMWKNIVQPDRPQMTVWHMLNACWILEATNIHSEYVIHIAFSLLQWLRKRTSLLRYMYFARFVSYCDDSQLVQTDWAEYLPQPWLVSSE